MLHCKLQHEIANPDDLLLHKVALADAELQLAVSARAVTEVQQHSLTCATSIQPSFMACRKLLLYTAMRSACSLISEQQLGLQQDTQWLCCHSWPQGSKLLTCGCTERPASKPALRACRLVGRWAESAGS